MEEQVVTAVVYEIFRPSRDIIVSGLQGITEIEPAFDFGKVNYVIDRDQLAYRLQAMTESIAKLAVKAAIPKIRAEVEKETRDMIRQMI